MSDPTSPPSRRNHKVWIAVTSIVLAIVVYFVFFTSTPEEATRDGAGAPPVVGVEPADGDPAAAD
ncbi:hypothetical protein [Aurantimonas sp. HBX-1]|uniref:hypothetical protein n=1 Tax=Aurantimonas sp. HBX-1 TaxID=2906072 RepID=UPI001F40AF6C|nr:hypothetical protein [Aurantimonas sp. HBX-1]UIJ73540.1 hypothetical protein LXB15_07890 [Aurantimonas sp. HBX-1]